MLLRHEADQSLNVLVYAFDAAETENSLMPARFYALWDVLIVEVALAAGCEILLSEDMQNRLFIDQVLTVQNPFLAMITSNQQNVWSSDIELQDWQTIRSRPSSSQ